MHVESVLDNLHASARIFPPKMVALFTASDKEWHNSGRDSTMSDWYLRFGGAMPLSILKLLCKALARGSVKWTYDDIDIHVFQDIRSHPVTHPAVSTFCLVCQSTILSGIRPLTISGAYKSLWRTALAPT